VGEIKYLSLNVKNIAGIMLQDFVIYIYVYNILKLCIIRSEQIVPHSDQ
jgi:hypothetical protein